MSKLALLVRLEAKPGKEDELRSFLKSGLEIVVAEPATDAWFAIQMGPKPSASLIHFRMKQEGRRICQDRLPQL
jgi:hypothetical protein